MKKKILFTLLTLALFICLFTVAVSAAAQSYSSYEVTLTDGTTKTVYAAGVDQWEGRVYLNAKLYAEAPLDSDGTYEEVDWTTVEELDFSNVMLYVYDSNKKVWNEREYGSNQGNTALCLYPNGLNKKTQLTSLKKVTTGKIVTLREGAFNRAPALETLVISSNLKYIQNNAFYYCNTLKEIKFDGVSSLETITDSFVGCTSLTEVYLPASLKSLNNTFNGCTSLKNVDLGGVTSIGSSTFNGCTSLESIYIPASVTYIGSDCWRGCTGVTKITFDPNCPVTHIYAHTFDGTRATEITLPNSVTSIGQNAFASSTLTTINLGASFNNFNASNASQAPLSGRNIEYLYLSDTFTSEQLRNNIFNWTDTNNANDLKVICYKLVVFYSGDKAAAEAIINKAKTGGENGAMLNGFFASMTLLTVEEYEKAVADGTLVIGTNGAPARYMVYGYNKCEAFYDGNHAISEDATLKFEGEDYISRYISVCACTRGCGSDAVTEICGPLFKNKGYSVYEENSKGNITYGIYVDEANVEAYEKFTGNDVSFGFVVGNVNDELDGKIIGNDGTCLLAGAIATDFATIDFKSFSVYNLKLTGIETDVQKAKSIYCGTYVVDGGIVSYIGDNVTDKSVAVSYNAIYEAKKDEE
ncbi:MAG: leucine-rich repeat domain-containing protein [Clostridia bacterium]|nr:leucine-rich repeat domain-containing protein [Clostridia bacterium]